MAISQTICPLSTTGDKNDDEGKKAAKMLEVLKNLDPGAGVLYDEGEETLGETDSGLRNLYPETDENAEHEGTFICSIQNINSGQRP